MVTYPHTTETHWRTTNDQADMLWCFKMSICKTCYKDSKDHTKQLWQIHHREEVCALCGKPGSSHSKRLWEMHSLTARKAPQGIIWPLKIGYSRKVPAVIVGEFAWKNQLLKDLKPIYMECQNCKLYLGDSEVDLADVLDGVCLKCFRELTNQTHPWYDTPSTIKQVNKQ